MIASSRHVAIAQPTPAAPPHVPRATRQSLASSPAREDLAQLSETTSNISGDSEMAFRYARTLSQVTGIQARDEAIMLEEMPLHSTFGQWWTQLGRAMQSAQVLEWIRREGVDPQSIRIKPDTGQVFYKHKRPNATLHVVGPQDKAWATVSGPVMAAGRAISSFYSFKPPLSEHSDSAPLKLVRLFYFERRADTPLEAQQQAARLDQDKAFVSMDPADYPAIYAARSQEALNEQKRVLGDNSNLYFLLGELRHLCRGLDSGSVLSDEIADYLQRTRLDIHPDSSWGQAFVPQAGAKVSLFDYIRKNGWDLPTNAEQVQNLLDALPKTLEKGPALGNYSGALSWPMPLDAQGQLTLRSTLRHGTVGDLDVSPYKNVLEYLMHGTSLEPSQLANPSRVLDSLIQSPRGQALGLAIQARFEANSIKGSINDWLLAALSQDTDTPAPSSSSTRTWVAGFNLAGDQHWGRPASQTVTRLAEHLHTSGRSSSPEKARLQAHLLLSSRAPEFLVKGLPEQLLYGSHGWVSFTTAVARIESATPGATADMSYAEVMAWASTAPVTQTQRQVEWEAQNTALKDWGVANGVIESSPDDVYSDGQMQQVRSAFNEQIQALKQASEARGSDAPDLHKRMDDQLRAALGPDVDLEAKVIDLSPAHVDFPGPYSIKDLCLKERLFSLPGKSSALDDFKAGRFFPFISVSQAITQTSGSDYRWVSLSDKLDIADVASKLKGGPDLVGAFRQDLSTYAKAMEESVEVGIRFKLSELPIEEQKDLQYGALSVFREVGVSRDNFGKTTRRVGQPPQYGASNESEPTELILRTTRNGHTRHYQVNVDGTIKQRPDLGLFEPGPQPSNHTHFHYDMEPVKLSVDGLDSASGLSEETPDGRTPQSFNSDRTKAIARTVTQELDLANKIQQQGQVLTTFDQEVPTYKKIQEVVLNLVPFYSAIVSFTKGDIGGGITDLAFDALGFLTAGAGAVGKGAKVLRSAASGLSKASKLTGIIGRAAIGAINPLDGLADAGRSLLSGGKKLWSAGVREVRQLSTLAHSSNSYDLIAASKHYDASAVGTFKRNNEIQEAPAIIQDGKWYAYDPIAGQPYGAPLPDFLPSARVHATDFERWTTAATAQKPIAEGIVNNWKKTVNAHRNGPDKAAFERGYRYGDIQTIKGAHPNMSAADVMKLARNKELTTEQVGMLVNKYDALAYEFGRTGSARFIDRIEPRFGNVTPMPQVIYLTQTAQLSEGQCAALSRAMATAMAQGKEEILIKNMFTAAAFPRDPASRSFMNRLNRLQNQVGGQSAFHAGQPVRQVSYQGMIKELSQTNTSKSLMIDSPGHAMAAGVRVEGTSKTYYFYDPNHGLATFSSAEGMEGGLKRVFEDKKLAKGYKTHSTDPEKLEFKIFDHDDAWQAKNSVFGSDLTPLYDAPIPLCTKPRSLSNVELKTNWEALHTHPDNQGLICYEASMRVGQAENTLSAAAFDAVKASTNRTGGTNYSADYLKLMGIESNSLKTTFDPALITESGLLNFRHAKEGGVFGHTVYVQKSSNNELFLFNTNSPDLDLAMIKNGNPPQISGGMSVYNLGNGNHKGLQDFLDGFNAKEGWQYAYTPASTLNANVKTLQP